MHMDTSSISFYLPYPINEPMNMEGRWKTDCDSHSKFFKLLELNSIRTNLFGSAYQQLTGSKMAGTLNNQSSIAENWKSSDVQQYMFRAEGWIQHKKLH